MAGVPQAVAELRDRFHEMYPASGEPVIVRAPGRVNLIGEHTDYNLGLVLPMAIDLACFAAAAPSGDEWLRVYSEQLGMAEWRMDRIATLSPRGEWSDRAAGVAWVLARLGVRLTGQNLLVNSTVPLGGGLSSSAALGVAVALALGGPRDPRELAQVAHRAETDFVGVPCGIMDQFISANGEEGAAVMLDCRTLDSRVVKLPEGIGIVTANSMVKHELGNSAYRTRVAECAEAARLLGVASLRDATLQDLKRLSGIPLRRARHVITENGRVMEFASAACGGQAEAMGRMMVESHASLRDDYEVSCPELDFLVDTALGVPGVFGARMTGGGFGGSTVNLVRTDAVERLESVLVGEYQKRWGLTPEIHRCRASAGAHYIFP